MPDFGKYLRVTRETSGIGLNELARQAGMSPTFLSLIERGLQPPPGVEKLQALARILNQQPDEFLARAGKLPPDIPPIIGRHQRHFAALLRSMRKLNEDELDVFMAQLGAAVEAAFNSNKSAPNSTEHWLLLMKRGAVQTLPSRFDLKPLQPWVAGEAQERS